MAWMSESPYWVHHFVLYGRTHLCVVLVFAAIVAVLATFRQINGIADVQPRRRIFDRTIGWVALCAALYVQAATLWPSRFDYRTALPLHICDIGMLVAPLALLLRLHSLRVITYFWGLGLSSISFIYPDLRFGVGDFQFWVFWLGHAVIVGCSLYDIFGRGFRPTWRDYVFIGWLSLAYVAIIFPIDALFHLNYGYVGQTYHGQRSPLDFLGPWPRRVPIMFALTMVVMLLLETPWLVSHKLGRNRPPEVAAPTP